MNKRWQAGLRIAAAAAVIAAMTGCATGPQEGAETVSKTLDEAKADLWTVEAELISYVPDDVVTERYPHSETSRVLFECGEGQYTWPGAAQVAIDPATDTDALIDQIHDDWSSKPDWTAEWVTTESSKYLSLVRGDGLRFSVGTLKGKTMFSVGSFSSCFELADYSPHDEY